MTIDTKSLQPGQKVGVRRIENSRKSLIWIETVKKVSPTGQVTLESNRFQRFGKDGWEKTGVASYIYRAAQLIPVEEAEKLLEDQQQQEQAKKLEYEAWLKTPEGKRKVCPSEATEAAIAVLKRHGWYSDENGHMDALESEIQILVERYCQEYDPI